MLGAGLPPLVAVLLSRQSAIAAEVAESEEEPEGAAVVPG